MRKKKRKFYLESGVDTSVQTCQRFFEENPLFTVEIHSWRGKEVRVHFNAVDRPVRYVSGYVLNPREVLDNADNRYMEIRTPNGTIRVVTDDRLHGYVRLRKFYFDSTDKTRQYTFVFSDEINRNEFINYIRCHRMRKTKIVRCRSKDSKISLAAQYRTAISRETSHGRDQVYADIIGSENGKVWTLRINNLY